MHSQKSLKDLFYSLATKYYADIDTPNGRIPISIQATFYFILTKYFKDVKIGFGAEEKDIRLSIFSIEDARSGKGQLIKTMELILEKLGISFVRETKFNSASLIGTISEHAINLNREKRKVPGDQGYVEPRIYGDLYYYDVLIFPEAKKLLVGTQDKEELLEDLQEALDSPGKIRKKMKLDVSLEYDTNASLYCTTYYAKEITEQLLYKGFYQRVLLIMRELTGDETIQLRNKIIDMFKEDPNLKPKFEQELEEFVTRVKQINNSYRVMHLTPEAIEFLHKLMDSYKTKLDEAIGDELTILKSFSQTIIDITVKIGTVIALVNGKENIISNDDLTVSLKFAKSALDTIINKLVVKESTKIDKNLVEPKIINVYKDLYTTDKKVTRKILLERCMDFGMNIGNNKLQKIINRMVEQQFFKEEPGERNERFLILNR